MAIDGKLFDVDIMLQYQNVVVSNKNNVSRSRAV